MPAFVISEVAILDETIANEYRPIAAASIAEYGGRYLARGVEPDVVEGPPTTARIVIVEFPSLQRAREWYASDSYARALKLRSGALERRLMFVDGAVAG
jgi:uncharacterized protein (DUF1330 family)